jgi:hypothetical protein
MKQGLKQAVKRLKKTISLWGEGGREVGLKFNC